ncbi:MATE family efflux transporter [Acaryochloris marina]|uniref:MATE family efflux transporter n=1 Tax=Acaryochloris marina TaxID=155978 RepID=UPI00201772E5|nr:MATE family efflux transporter [Acaryochloris marina]
MGTTILAENGLLLQIALLSQFTVNGVGLITQTLVGNFKGKGESERIMPVLYTSIVHGLLISLPFAVLSVLFPVTVFGLLTSHIEVSYSIHAYVIWLVPLLSLTAVAFVLEGYFIGLKEGAILRNSALTALGMGYAPIAIAGWYFQSNHLLWTSLTIYMATLMFSLSLQILKNQQNYQSSLGQT